MKSELNLPEVSVKMVTNARSKRRRKYLIQQSSNVETSLSLMTERSFYPKNLYTKTTYLIVKNIFFFDSKEHKRFRDVQAGFLEIKI